VTNGAISIGIGGGATGGTTVTPAIPEPAIDEKGGLVVADVAPVQPFGIRRDTFWPRSVAAWIVLSVVLILASVQLVSPTRRWRPRFPRLPSRRTT
jgi:hypothetical protein